ncbi:unnamed protein product [Paramecium primaurelia]|uniref:Uncharacterized protein n=1 Tax=Paramecium primaurelia TaxID=5886 RepID=A0A8S1M042_PARPR|nr:unnamed protein product [Paramecium primaurelia]
MRIFFFVGLITLSNCVQFSLLQRCACSEYGQTLCKPLTYCVWTGSACVDMDCTYLKSADTCTGPKSEYKCSWNISSNKCETHSYTCSEISEEDCGLKLYGFDCMWANDKCTKFSCAFATIEDCSSYTCAMIYSNRACKDPQSLDCSSFSNKETCNQSDGNGNMCYFNNNSLCTKYDMLSGNCSHYSDVKEYCNLYCTYNDSTKTCQPKSCADFTTQEDCYAQIDIPGLKGIPCTWTGTVCQESTASEIEQLDILSCMMKTMIHYKWSLDNNKCTACTKFTSNPNFKVFEDQISNKNESKSENENENESKSENENDSESQRKNFSIQIIGMIVGLSLILN